MENELPTDDALKLSYEYKKWSEYFEKMKQQIFSKKRVNCRYDFGKTVYKIGWWEKPIT